MADDELTPKDNLPEKPQDFPVDFDHKDKADLELFIQSGLPGISFVKDEKLKEAAELYFNGFTYKEISNKTGIKKNIILYMANKFKWYDTKIDIYQILIKSVREKSEIAYLKSVDVISELMSSFESYYKNITEQYRLSKQASVLDNADWEKLKIYMKCMEQINKIRSSDRPQESAGPVMNVNLPQNSTIKKIDGNTIEISSPQDLVSKQIGDVLEALAEIKKNAQKKEP